MHGSLFLLGSAADGAVGSQEPPLLASKLHFHEVFFIPSHRDAVTAFLLESYFCKQKIMALLQILTFCLLLKKSSNLTL